jgi:hypothetical protein
LSHFPYPFCYSESKREDNQIGAPSICFLRDAANIADVFYRKHSPLDVRSRGDSSRNLFPLDSTMALALGR